MFEAQESKLRDLLRQVNEIRNPSEATSNQLYTIYNMTEEIIGNMAIVAKYPILAKELQILTPKIQSIRMHHLLRMSQGIGMVDDAASSDFKVDQDTLNEFKTAFQLPIEEDWETFFEKLDAIIKLDDIEKDRKTEFVKNERNADGSSIPFFNEDISIADIWDQKARETIKIKLLSGGSGDRTMREMLLHQMALCWNKRKEDLKSLNYKWIDQLSHEETRGQAINDIAQQCPILLPADEMTEESKASIIIKNIKKEITDIVSAPVGALIESAVSAYDNDQFSCTHGIINRLKLNLQAMGVDPVDISKLLLEIMGQMSAVDGSTAPFASLLADKVVTFQPEQAIFDTAEFAQYLVENLETEGFELPQFIKKHMESGGDMSPEVLAQEIKKELIGQEEITIEDVKIALQSNRYEKLRTTLNISDTDLGQMEDAKVLLDTKITQYLKEGKDKDALRKILIITFSIPINLDQEDYLDKCHKQIIRIVKSNRNDVDITSEQAQRTLGLDLETLKRCSTLYFTEEKEEYIEKFKQVLLNSGFPDVFVETLDIKPVIDMFGNMTYGGIEIGYEERLEYLKKEMITNAQKRLDQVLRYSATHRTSITDETIFNYQFLSQLDALPDEIVPRIISLIDITNSIYNTSSHNNIWMALKVGAVDSTHLSANELSLLQN